MLSAIRATVTPKYYIPRQRFCSTQTQDQALGSDVDNPQMRTFACRTADGTENPDLTWSCNFSTEQTIASFPYWGPSLVCSPSMLLFRQRSAAFQPSAPHTSFLFLSPCPPSCFPSLRIKVTQSGWTDPSGSSSIYLFNGGGRRGGAPLVFWGFLICIAGLQ